LGGLSKRATIIDKLKGDGPVIIVDGGNMFWKTPKLIGDRRQRDIKAKLQSDAFTLSGLDVFVPGSGDFSLGLERFDELTTGWTVLAGNLTCGERSWPTTTVVERGGRRIGFIGVVDYAPDGCEASDPLDAARTGAESLGAVDATVLIAHMDSRKIIKAAEEIPGLDFVINGQTRQRHAAPMGMNNGAFQLGVGSKGKVLGALLLDFSKGGEGWSSDGSTQRLEDDIERFEERRESAKADLEATTDAKEQKRLKRQIEYYQQKVDEARAELEEIENAPEGVTNRFQNQLRELDDGVADQSSTEALVVAALAEIDALPPLKHEATPKATPFIGSNTCRGCHQEPFAQWEATAHPQAWQTLVDEKRARDEDCFGCHVTGATDPLGPQNVDAVTPELRGVGCESCHGPGVEHLKGPLSDSMTLPTVETCVQCHDGERDEGRFDHEAYLPRVSH